MQVWRATGNYLLTNCIRVWEWTYGHFELQSRETTEYNLSRVLRFSKWTVKYRNNSLRYWEWVLYTNLLWNKVSVDKLIFINIVSILSRSADVWLLDNLRYIETDRYTEVIPLIIIRPNIPTEGSNSMQISIRIYLLSTLECTIKRL